MAGVAGLSSLGILFGWAQGALSDTAPTSFKLLTRINTIAGIALSTETIDASALEDYTTRNIAGRQDTGGTWTVTINLTDETIAEWEEVVQASQTAKAAGEGIWFEVYHPDMAKGFFVIAEPPKILPVPEFSQNALMTAELTLTINEYKGMMTKVKPTAGA